jgi:GR25 family glycosyltransferase involved in LPS biosynthesis
MSSAKNLTVFVINLDRSPERLRHFVADNALPGIDIARVPAVDGKDLNRAELVARGIIADDLVYTDGCIGCSLSHMTCWQEAVRRNEAIVVCEDEAVLRHDFATVHRDLSTEIAQSDIVFWGFNRDMHIAYDVPGLGECISIFDDDHLNDEARIGGFQAAATPTKLWRVRRIFGMPCYTITPKGAARLMGRLLPLRNGVASARYASGLGKHHQLRFQSLGIDMDVGIVHIDAINARVAVPPLAVSRHDKANSTLGGEDWRTRLQPGARLGIGQ